MSDRPGPWVAVAAEGTDPAALAAVASALHRQPRGARAAVRRAVDGGEDVPAALQTLTTPSLLGSETRVAEDWGRHDVTVALAGDPGDPVGRRWPGLVAVRGCPQPTGPAVAIVGARRATPYGTGVAAWVAESCGRAGVRVVSGGAVGIDAAAHDAAADTPGGTTVVLGCGHAVAYPRPHHGDGRLFDRVLAGGGTVLSENLPGDQPAPFRVRDRNRLLAALADVVVVVEGSERSGSLLTATAAADLGVPVLAVPGDVRAPGSGAPHRLLAEGAGVCRRPDDVLALLDATAAADPDGGDPRVAVGGLPDAAVDLLVAAWPRPVPVDALAAAADVPAGTLLGALTRARVDGVLAQGPEGVRLRRAPP